MESHKNKRKYSKNNELSSSKPSTSKRPRELLQQSSLEGNYEDEAEFVGDDDNEDEFLNELYLYYANEEDFTEVGQDLEFEEDDYYYEEQDDEYSDDEDDYKDNAKTIKLPGVRQVLHRGEKDTIFKAMFEFKEKNSTYNTKYQAKDYSSCCDTLWTFFKKNLSEYRPGVFSASIVGPTIKAYKRWSEYRRPFPHTCIKLMMDNSYRRPRHGQFDIIDAQLHYSDDQPVPYDSTLSQTPQQLGIDMEPYMRRLLEHKLLQDTKEKWKVLESGTMMSQDGLCICRIDGVAVKVNDKRQMKFIEMKFVQPFKMYENLDSALENGSDKFNASLPIVKDSQGNYMVNTNHRYGHQTRLSMSILKMETGLLVFGLKDLPDNTNDVSKIDYVEFKETIDYLEEYRDTLFQIVKEILIPLIVHDKIDGKGNASTDYSNETQFCRLCQQDIQIIFWNERKHLNTHRICNKCGKDCKLMRDLKVHRRDKHEEEPTYECQHCDKKCTTLDALMNHEIRHSGVKGFVCDHPKCTKDFYTNSDLQRHKVIHYEKGDPRRVQWVCPSCNKSVDLFLQNIHTRFCIKYRKDNNLSQPDFTCIGCSKDCQNYNSLNNHRRECVEHLKLTLNEEEKLLNETQQLKIIQEKIQNKKWTCTCGQKCDYGKRQNHIIKCKVYQDAHPNQNVYFVCQGCDKNIQTKSKGDHFRSCDKYIALSIDKEKLAKMTDEEKQDRVNELKNEMKKECPFCLKRVLGLPRHLNGCKDKVLSELTEQERKGKSQKELEALAKAKIKASWNTCPHCGKHFSDVNGHVKNCKLNPENVREG